MVLAVQICYFNIFMWNFIVIWILTPVQFMWKTVYMYFDMQQYSLCNYEFYWVFVYKLSILEIWLRQPFSYENSYKIIFILIWFDIKPSLMLQSTFNKKCKQIWKKKVYTMLSKMESNWEGGKPANK